MSKHTPGPWRWGNNRTSLIGREGAVVLADGDEVWDLCSYAAIVQGDAKRADADARLIAAAPDLLEALQVAADALCDLPLMDPRVVAIRAAIAKATGGNDE